MPFLFSAASKTVITDPKHRAQDAVAWHPVPYITQPQSTPVALRAIVHGERQCF